MLTIISMVAAALGLGVAWWQSRKVSRTMQALARAQKSLPCLVADTLRTITKINQSEGATEPERARGWAGRVDYVDVNEDGQEELLVQYPAGAHGCALKILAWRGSQFEELANVGTGTPFGFEFGDFDGDGKIEIKTQETDWSSGLPYASAPRVVLLLRWNGAGFVEVTRNELPHGAAP